jgi:hypothetical protein
MEIEGQTLICDVCRKNQALGVASCLAAQPMSIAYCRTCLDWYAEALWIVTATVFCCDGPEHMAAWFWGLMTFQEDRYLSVRQLYLRQATMDMI